MGKSKKKLQENTWATLAHFFLLLLRCTPPASQPLTTTQRIELWVSQQLLITTLRLAGWLEENRDSFYYYLLVNKEVTTAADSWVLCFFFCGRRTSFFHTQIAIIFTHFSHTLFFVFHLVLLNTKLKLDFLTFIYITKKLDLTSGNYLENNFD